MNPLTCWCGSTELVPASHKEYLVCRTCGTGQLKRLVELKASGETLDLSEIYKASYWEEHMKDMGFPTIPERARGDLSERSVYWLKHLLKYKVSSGRALELGCAHGGFVKLMSAAGFDAMGMEMDADIVRQASQWFGIRVVQGPIEAVQETLGRFDLIAMFDVLEHFPDPVGTMSEIVKHLVPGGVLMFQTPDFTTQNGPSWKHFKPPEHTYLFTQDSARLLMKRSGLTSCAFEPSIFDFDMFAFASAEPIRVLSQDQISAGLLRSSDSRVVLGLLDTYEKLRSATEVAQKDAIDRYGFVRLVWHAMRAVRSKLGLGR